VDPVRHSRYCKRFFDLGSGEGVQERWLAWLTREHASRVVLPCNDDGLELVAKRRSELHAVGCSTIEANDAVLLAMLDKSRTYELASRLDIAVPRTWGVRSPEELERAISTVGFPLALKPRHSYVFARHYGLRTKLFVVEDRAAASAILDRARPLDLELIVTEIIPGPDDQLWTYTAYLDGDGAPLVGYTRRKIRQYPPHFGRGSYYALEWDAEVAATGLRFFRGVGLRGLASVEFKRDPRDGQLKLIECNHRFDGAVELARVAGTDLAELTYERILGRTSSPQQPREGVRLWSPIEDSRSAFRSWRQNELSLRDWGGTLLSRPHFQLFTWRDPKPSAMTVARIVRGGLRALVTRRR
jgi:predicted ATP-grasp superfamily ATP-dependent carboligase